MLPDYEKIENYTSEDLKKLSSVRNMVEILEEKFEPITPFSVIHTFNYDVYSRFLDNTDSFAKLLSDCEEYLNYCIDPYRINIDDIIEIMDVGIYDGKEYGYKYVAGVINPCWAHNVPYDFSNSSDCRYGFHSFLCFNNEEDLTTLYEKVLKTNWELGGDDLFQGWDGSVMDSTMRCFINDIWMDGEDAKKLKVMFKTKVFTRLFSIYNNLK